MRCKITRVSGQVRKEWVKRLRTAELRSRGKTCVFCCSRRTAAELMMRPRSLSKADNKVCNGLFLITRLLVIFLVKSIINNPLLLIIFKRL